MRPGRMVLEPTDSYGHNISSERYSDGMILLEHLNYYLDSRIDRNRCPLCLEASGGVFSGFELNGYEAILPML